MEISKNYYISSLFWSTLSKVLTAIFGFITVPLLLGWYGKADYGLLALATSCNGYMHLLDLGMNIGAVKFYSQWKAEGKIDKIFRVARSNITFYMVISVINILLLIGVAFWGESLFAVTHQQFLLLRVCLCIIAIFNVLSWETTVFNQLLIADKQMGYTMKVQCVQSLLKGILVFIVYISSLKLSVYFFFLTAIIAIALFPYAYKCKKEGLIDSLRPSWYWTDFKVVITFCLSIFALSIFQATATQSRPILLSMFSNNGANAVADFRIVEVFPQLIIMIAGTFSGIFLPKTSEMVAKNDIASIHSFAYKWTTYTTAIVAAMCFPIMLCTKEILSAYVGSEYSYLSPWLTIWCVTVLIQMHTTPGNALVLAYGKTKLLVIVTSAACIFSMLINIVLCKYFNVGSAIIAYLIYVCIIIGLYYIVFFKKLLGLSRRKLLYCFIKPTIIGLIICIPVYFVNINHSMFGDINVRIAMLLVCIIKSLLWLVPYIVILYFFKIIDFKQLKK